MKAELIEGRMRQTTRLMSSERCRRRGAVRVYCNSECCSNNESTVVGDRTFSIECLGHDGHGGILDEPLKDVAVDHGCLLAWKFSSPCKERAYQKV